MCYRGTLWAILPVAVFAGLCGLGGGKAFGAAAAQEEEIRKDDTIEVVTETAPVKKGTPTLTTVEKGTKLKAIEVETNESGTWIKVKVEKDGKPIEGYIHKRHLKRVPEAPRPKPQPGEPPAKPEGGKVEGVVALEPVPATNAQRADWDTGLIPGTNPPFGVFHEIFRTGPGADGKAGSLMTEQENKQFTEFIGKTSLKDKQGRKAVVDKLVSIVGLKRARGTTLRFTDGEGRLGWVWPPSER
jgi:hypothetical protein